MLRKCRAGMRAAAWLERHVQADRHLHIHQPVMQMVFDAANRRARVDDDEEGDTEWAYGFIETLAHDVVTPPAFRVYAPLEDRLHSAKSWIMGSHEQLDGASRFCQERTKGLIEVHAPVINSIVKGVLSDAELNSALLRSQRQEAEPKLMMMLRMQQWAQGELHARPAAEAAAAAARSQSPGPADADEADEPE